MSPGNLTQAITHTSLFLHTSTQPPIQPSAYPDPASSLRDNLVDPAKLNTTSAAIRRYYEVGGQYVGYGITGNPRPTTPKGNNSTSDHLDHLDIPDNAVNPAWRTAALHLLPCRFWDAGSSLADVAAYSADMTASWMPIIRDATPGSGGYASEGDVSEPDFKESFYGLEKYERLYGIKRRYDPTGLFYANKGVGSDEWYVTGQVEGFPTQDGRLCRV